MTHFVDLGEHGGPREEDVVCMGSWGPRGTNARRGGKFVEVRPDRRGQKQDVTKTEQGKIG